MIIRTLLLCMLVFASAVAVPAQSRPTRDEVLDRMAKALGGRERLARIESVRTRFAIEAAGLKGSGESLVTADGRVRFDFDLGGVVGGASGYDGKSGWARDLSGTVRERAGAEIEGDATLAYLATFSHLVPGRLPGRVELAGESADAAHYLLRVTADKGRTVTLYVNKTTFLADREEREDDGRTSRTVVEDWRAVDGVLFPFRSVQGTGDPRSAATLTVSEIRTNGPVDAAAFARPAESVASARFARGSSADGIPFEMNENHIFVETRVNGSEPLWFMFDTGAEATIVEASRAKAIGLELAGSVTARGNGEGTLQASVVKGVTIAVGGAEAPAQTVFAIPLGGIEMFEGRKIDGIIGYDFISKFVVEIDYAARRMHLFDPKTYAYRGAGERLPIAFVGKIPHVEATMDVPGHRAVAGSFLVDTGSRLSLSLNAPFVRENAWAREAAERAVPAPYGVGIGGESKSRVGRLGAFRLGRYAVERPVTGFTFDTGGVKASASHAGAIGGEVLRRFTVVFDYSRSAMYLEPNASFAEPFEYDMLGALLRSDGAAFVVHRVVENSAAAAAGLAEGDAIVAIDGRAASELSLEQARRLFRRDGHSHALTVRRGERTSEVRVQLKRIV